MMHMHILENRLFIRKIIRKFPIDNSMIFLNPIIDVVIISNAKNEELGLLTQQTVDTANQDKHINCIVIEQNFNIKYKNCKTFYLNVGFNYNKYLNIGAKLGKSQYICFTNNDVIFPKGWTKIIQLMKEYNVQSASGLCESFFKMEAFHDKWPQVTVPKDIQYGCRTGVEFTGWCFVWERKIYEDICRKDGGLIESVKFWYSDDCTEYQIRKYGIKHALFPSIRIYHLMNMTSSTLDDDSYRNYTLGQLEEYSKVIAQCI